MSPTPRVERRHRPGRPLDRRRPDSPEPGQYDRAEHRADANQYALTTWIEPNIQAGHQYDVTYMVNNVNYSLGTTTGLAM